MEPLLFFIQGVTLPPDFLPLLF
jgi:hypothetical protein